MSLREKSAWISLVIHVVIFGGYFWSLASAWDQPARGPIGVGMLIGAVILLVLNAIALNAAVALWSRKEAEAPADERERIIDMKAERIASYVLSGNVILLIGALLVNWDGFLVANLLLAAIVVSEVTKAVVQIVYHRADA
ncbi:MAG: cell envelope integrity protein TolA [Hyphomonadaceae bacterium]